jgi:acyl-CoA synthetase (AMP-forming)/AMP-acid ligase II
MTDMERRKYDPGYIEAQRNAGLWARGTLADYAVEEADRNPDTPVFLGERRSVDFASLLREADSLAAALWNLGLRPGEVIAFQLPNWFEAAVINLAACRLGLVCAPLLPIYRDAELTVMINDSKCRVVFIPAVFRSFDFEEMFERIQPALTARPIIVTVRGSGNDSTSYEGLLAAGAGQSVAWPRVAVDSVKLLLYTSGTTGRAKAVLHSHETLARAILTTAARWQIGPGDVVLMPSPVTHATGYANALELPFLLGTRSVLMDRWDASTAVELIDKFNVAATVGATPFLRELTAAARAVKSNLSSLRVFACGGASVPPEVVDEANRIFRNKPAFRVYGSSEAPYVAIGRPNLQTSAEAATTDGEVTDYEIRIVDDRGDTVAPGSDGEILVRGPALFLGYASEADNTDCFTADGLFRTGDMGTAGPGTYLTITGRKKDLIIRGGENISAREIEDVLHGHPSIAEVSVVSMPHERLGEGIFAFIVASDGSAPDLQSIHTYLEGRRLSRQKFPERMAVVTELPRTASGKVRKDVLRAMAADTVRV